MWADLTFLTKRAAPVTGPWQPSGGSHFSPGCPGGWGPRGGRAGRCRFQAQGQSSFLCGQPCSPAHAQVAQVHPRLVLLRLIFERKIMKQSFPLHLPNHPVRLYHLFSNLISFFQKRFPKMFLLSPCLHGNDNISFSYILKTAFIEKIMSR